MNTNTEAIQLLNGRLSQIRSEVEALEKLIAKHKESVKSLTIQDRSYTEAIVLLSKETP